MVELPPLLADLQKKLSDAMASGPAAQVQAQLRQTLDATLQKIDLVTREEFDQQGLLLEHALMKLAELEAQLKAVTSGRPCPGEPSGVGEISVGCNPSETNKSP
jgi:BMFP domain-containing protein YqiC